MKKTFLLVTVFYLIAPLFLIQQTAFAGDPNCQNGYIPNPYNSHPPPRLAKNLVNREQRQFAAAQIRNERNQPPGAGLLRGGDTQTRSNLSFFSSILVLLGGIWALLVLLRQRLGKSTKQNRARLPKMFKFAFEPSFALSIFGFLFAAAIVGSALTAPTAVTAEKRDQRDKRKMTGFMNPSNKPVFKSAQQIGGDELTQIGAPVFDGAGNRYVRGTFTENLTIGSTTLHASRYFDLFFAKYDANGNALWARQAFGATTEIAAAMTVEGATAMAVDASGNVYVGGSFVKKLTLQGGANPNITLNDNGAAGVNYESFVAKYNANGNLLWAKGGNSGSPKSAVNLETGQNSISQIVFDASGDPYVSGSVSGTKFLGSSIVGNGKTDILLAKLNGANGAVVWRRVIGGAEDENGLDLEIDGSNNLYLIGNFGSPKITFLTNPTTTFGNPDNLGGELEDSTDVFIAKFDSSGDALWAENLNNNGTVGSSQIAVNSAGEIFLTGYFFDSVAFPTVPETVLTETEGSGEDEDALGGYVTKLDTDGYFMWAKGFGGVGKAIALDQVGRVHVVGTFWDGGTFGLDTANEDVLASFGGVDLFVARYDSDGGFDWAKPIAASGQEGLIAIGNTDENEQTENNYNPLGISYNPARDSMFVSSDFQGTVALDCLTLQTSGGLSRHSYIAELSGDSEAVSCRIWNGLDEDDNDFDSPDNWNGGILPSVNDSVYVPYTGNNFDAPDYNPVSNVVLTNLTIADDRILTLERDLTVNGRLDLLGGFVDADNYTLHLGASAGALSISEGYVVGRLQKQFAAAASFTFPVGDNGYSPVTLSNVTGSGSFTVDAFDGAYPNQATDLPANRATRWWNLTNGNLTKADLTFQYVAGDITTGYESYYGAYRIPTGGGTATRVYGSTSAHTKTVTASNVTEFSDWTLAQFNPTAASVAVGGRVTTANRRGIAQARITLTDEANNVRTMLTNSLGYYRFADVPAGTAHVFSVSHKRYKFSEPSQVQYLTGERDDINFAAAP